MRYYRLIYRLVGLLLIQLIMGIVGLGTVIVLRPFQNTHYTVIARVMQVWGKLCCLMLNIHIQQSDST